MRIDVTQADIDAGEPNTLTRCALATAIKRAFNTIGVSVSGFGEVWIDRRCYELPVNVDVWRSRYDTGAFCAPISFDLG